MHLKRSIRRRAGLAFALLACGALGACDRSPTPSEHAQRNVLLIVVDTLRADKLGCYGSTLGLTPHLDAVAQNGTRFDQAFAHSPWTLPSIASLLTSTHPSSHGAGRASGDYTPLADAVRTLAECFHEAGHATGAVVNVLFLAERFGMAQGYSAEDYDFAEAENNMNERRAGPTTDAAIRWIGDHKDRPFFCMVHYFDPHLTYDPPAEFRRRFAAPQDQDTAQRLFGTVKDVMKLRRQETTLSEKTVRRLEMLYHGEVAYTDEQIGRLLAELDKLGLGDSTIVAITADHGEEFLDHGGFEHGHTVYDELLHVPLILRLPGVIPARTVRSTVGLLDLAPTLCDLAGVAPESAFVGRSLLPLIDGAEREHRAIFSEGLLWGPPQFSWRRGPHKLIRRHETSELYDLGFDPRERDNLASRKPDLCESMTKTLAQALHDARDLGAACRASEIRPVTLSPAEVERLRSLGYVGGAEDGLSEASPADKAERMLRELVATEPSNLDLRRRLATELLDGARLEEAATQFAAILELQPDDARAHHRLGVALSRLGQWDEGIAHLRRAAELMPQTPEAHGDLALALLDRGRYDEALRRFQKAVELDPANEDIRVGLSEALYHDRRYAEALAVLREGLEHRPGSLMVANNLSWYLATLPSAGLRDGAEAVRLAESLQRRVRQGRPDFLDTLAAAYAEAGRFDQAVAAAERALQTARAMDHAELAEQIQQRLALYRAGRPYHEGP